MYYDHKQRNGKNSKLYYYLSGLLRFYGPCRHLRRKLGRVLQSVDSRDDRDYILDRVGYYNKLSGFVGLGDDTSCIACQNVIKGKSAYVLDSQEYLRWFPENLRWNYMFGDITDVPDVPTIVKSRPIACDNANSVLLNLDKVRHFTFLKDKIRFGEKEGRVVFRGDISPGKPLRGLFMEKFFGHPLFDAGVLKSSEQYPPQWSTPGRLSLWEHLKYRYIMAIEGNDVASNMKWIMSSNSVAVCPAPVYETWFMEGRLVANVHYIEVRPDYSDLEEKIDYYNGHPREAEIIVRNAHEYIGQFLNPEREDLISLLVLDKYFKVTGQL